MLQWQTHGFITLQQSVTNAFCQLPSALDNGNAVKKHPPVMTELGLKYAGTTEHITGMCVCVFHVMCHLRLPNTRLKSFNDARKLRR